MHKLGLIIQVKSFVSELRQQLFERRGAISTQFDSEFWSINLQLLLHTVQQQGYTFEK